jgi:imidazole glycerol-phosphate synthase subunit HisH
MITIVDYNGGNLRSVKRACDALGLVSELTQDPDRVRRAERIIFPGVGAACSAMETLERLGLDEALQEAFTQGVPILGICVGAQIVLERSEEGDVPCLGIVRGLTRRLKRVDQRIKIPHMGWNQIRVTRPHPLLEGWRSTDEVYFVHSYYLDPSDPKVVHATTDHGFEFCCALARDNLFATQFHPEKSGPVGLALLDRFTRWEGTPC